MGILPFKNVKVKENFCLTRNHRLLINRNFVFFWYHSIEDPPDFLSQKIQNSCLQKTMVPWQVGRNSDSRVPTVEPVPIFDTSDCSDPPLLVSQKNFFLWKTETGKKIAHPYIMFLHIFF
uniref:Uncharacterized protein n=1 Tax=Meloidogyne enterolobii TaxID=390850 RepID=A0A6V7UGU3_MELEN|nr:unnamed protein product [Meloidogyne enterolobii]